MQAVLLLAAERISDFLEEWIIPLSNWKNIHYFRIFRYLFPRYAKIFRWHRCMLREVCSAHRWIERRLKYHRLQKSPKQARNDKKHLADLRVEPRRLFPLVRVEPRHQMALDAWIFEENHPLRKETHKILQPPSKTELGHLQSCNTSQKWELGS